MIHTYCLSCDSPISRDLERCDVCGALQPDRNVDFEIDPLDLGISSLHLKLTEHLNKCLETQKAEQFSAEFVSRDPAMQGLRVCVELIIACDIIRVNLNLNRNDGMTLRHTLLEGTLSDFISYVNRGQLLFNDVKIAVLWFADQH